MQTIRRVDPISAMKVLAVLQAAVGLCIGAVISLFSVLGFMAASAVDNGGGGFGFLFGTAAIVIFPIFYGIIGAIGGLIMSVIYNVIAKVTGGLQVELG